MDEVTVRRANDDLLNGALDGPPIAGRNRRFAFADDGCAKRLQSHQHGIKFIDPPGKRHRTRILDPPIEGAATGLCDFYDLDAVPRPSGSGDRPSQLRTRKAEQVAKRRVVVGIRRLACDLEPESVTVEGNAL